MRILVTGLCLQGNKGGPAIALSLKKQISKYVPSAEFTFSVPSGEEFQYEIPWGKHYGVSVVENFSESDLVGLFLPSRFGKANHKVRGWLKELWRSDLVIDMSGVSYVGPPVGSTRYMLFARFRNFALSKILRKKFLAWTQSYGPFSTKLIRLLAKLDLGSQPVIFCRGEDCQEAVMNLLPNKKAISFPDVAVILDYSRQEGKKLISETIGKSCDDKLITLSPSAVIYSKSKGEGSINTHIKQMVSLCQFLFDEGYFVLLVPHTYRPGRPSPRICDHAVCMQVLKALRPDSPVAMIRDDLSPAELKSIISCAFIHIGARYHSIIAALSSGVPCISLSWHPKYRDIMRMYGIQHFVYEAAEEGKVEDLYDFFKKLEENWHDFKQRIHQAQPRIVAMVEQNTRLFAQFM